MTRAKTVTTLGLLATFAAAALAPTAALADQQADKNNMRNLAIAGAAVAVYGLLNHNNTATLLGAAGAAVAGSQYEKDRKQQSQDNNWRYYRNGNNRYRDNSNRNNGNYRDTRTYRDNTDWNNQSQDNRNWDSRNYQDRNNNNQYDRNYHRR